DPASASVRDPNGWACPRGYHLERWRHHSQLQGVLHQQCGGCPCKSCNEKCNAVQWILWLFLVPPPGVCIQGCIKYPVSTGAVDDRTERAKVADMAEAAQTKRTVRGVKGPSPLFNVPGFNIVLSFSPDYMHCALLGVTRQFAELLFSSVGEQFYIGDPARQSVVNKRLCSLKPPQCFNRGPRALKLRKYWKAAECQCWLLYYCLPCLKSVLPVQYYEHFELFVSALYLLAKTDVEAKDIDVSTEKITGFVVLTEYLYGKEHMSSNRHTLLHLPKAVLLQGPLWALSCFPFESNMGHLLKLVSSSNGVPFQILSRTFLRNSFFRTSEHGFERSARVSLAEEKGRQNNLKLLGKPRHLPEHLYELVEELAPEGTPELKEYDRVCVAWHTLHSTQYKAPSKRESTALKLGDLYARAEHILSAGSDESLNVYVVSHGYDVRDFGNVTHLKLARKQSVKKLHRPSGHVRPCMYLDVDGGVIFAELCNKYEWSYMIESLKGH
ncbi:unnamed protein product, partial [Ixodes pacificus]